MKKSLDLMKTNNLIDLFLQEEIRTINSIKKEKRNIAKAIKQILITVKNKGRVIYIGAGTSGRLGVLDASECRPTFSTNIFKSIIAGGRSAITKAKENAEDNVKAPIKDLKKINLSKKDILIGISASGETPYTLAAIKHAKKLRVKTIGITSNPESSLSRAAHYRIAPEINYEIISGSSRLKSGTAQKVILNVLSSVSMIKSGKVYKNLMIDVEPKNKKLVTRAIRIISIVCKVPLNRAKSLFHKAKKNTKCAIVMHYKQCDIKVAKQLLRKSNFNLRRVIR